MRQGSTERLNIGGGLELYAVDGEAQLTLTLEVGGLPVFQDTRRLATMEPVGDRTGIMLTDLRGSLVGLAHPEDGSWLAFQRFTPWGVEWDRSYGRGALKGFAGVERWTGEGVSILGRRAYDATLAHWLSPDRFALRNPEAFALRPAELDVYGYAGHNPVRNRDSSGEVVETAWDVANVAMGVASLTANLAAGNVGGALLDMVGLVVDGAATLTPVVPGGAGTLLKAYRAGDTIADVARNVDRGVDVLQKADRLGDAAIGGASRADFVVTETGTAVSTSQSRMRRGFEAAGFPSQATRQPGLEHMLPNGQRVRTMEASGQAPRRASFENANGQPVTPDGNVPQPPPGMSRAERRQWVREQTHVEQGP